MTESKENMPRFGRFHPLAGYLGLSAFYGFVRGWNADYRYDRYQREITRCEYDLSTKRYMDKLARGLVNASMYGSVGNPYALYKFLCRLEISLTGKNPYSHPDAYTEMFDVSTTLHPLK